MNRPQQYTIRNKRTNSYDETNNLSAYYLNNQGFDVWEDMRYPARMRLYKYWQRLNGIFEPKYSPFAGTEIGKSIVILNF